LASFGFASLIEEAEAEGAEGEGAGIEEAAAGGAGGATGATGATGGAFAAGAELCDAGVGDTGLTASLTTWLIT
jgi:hypothetical protein